MQKNDAPPFQPDPKRLYLVPLGGLGEIGKNMMAILYGDVMVCIDAGVMFPKDDMLGIDLIIPDIDFLLQHRDKLKGIFLTHGHEDHIGAIPYTLPKLEVPVYGTKLTLALVKGKLREFELDFTPEFHEINPSSKIDFGKVSLEFFPNVHSIHDGVGIVINTPVGRVVHSGDWKFDQTPVGGMTTDYKRLADLGHDGVLVALSDSTYAERPGYSVSEKVVGKSFEHLFGKAAGRVIVAMFASSIPRIQQVVDVAVKLKRKICFVGRSMVQNVKIATELGHLVIPTDATIVPDELENHEPSHVVIVTTGSQGEPVAALSLIAAGTHRSVEIIPGDTVVISATPIPGNEGLVSRIINQLYRQGAEVIYTLTSKQDDSSGFRVHVQGHAGQEELKLFLNLLKPKFFIPIHGEYRHLAQHVKLAREVGVAEENAMVAVDGDIIEITEKSAHIVQRLTMSSMLVHGYGIGEVGKSVMKERRAIGEEGILVLAIALSKETGAIIGEPEIATKGFISLSAAEPIVHEVRRIITDFFKNGAQIRPKDPEALKGNLKGELNKFFGEKMGRKPIIIPVLSWF